MAIKYEPTPWDLHFDPQEIDACPYGAEQEHIDSCDINKMLGNLIRGQEVRGSHQAPYGHDDTTMDGVQFRIQKAQLEQELSLGEKEFEEHIFNSIPKTIRDHFGMTIKKTKNAPNDDLTTKNANPTQPITSPVKVPPEPA